MTAFTVGHSLSLALATFEVIALPSTVVEPLIAASIVYVGLENLLRREPAQRELVTLGFGLVHGLGFASVLQESGVGSEAGLAEPLFGFNLGVELGQLAMAAVVLPLIWRWQGRPEVFARLATASSLVVTVAGVIWFFERVL